MVDITIPQFKKIVPPYGDPKRANLVFVGEAPGAEEEKEGRPFVGVSGQLLQECQHLSGIISTECYTTNVVKERPLGNDISPFFIPHEARKKVYGFTELAQPYLQALKLEIEGTKANVIVAVGEIALAALTGKFHITKWRGSILESTLVPGRKVVPCIHPAAALRQYIYKYSIIADLKRAKAQSQFPEIRRPNRTLKIFPTYGEAIAFLEYCYANQPHGVVSCDIEVVNQECSHFSLSVDPKYAMSIDFTSRYTVEEEADIWLHIAKILEDPKVVKLFQNGMSFDGPFLARKNGIITENMEDVMIAHHWVYPEFPQGLDFQCSVYTEEPYYKDEGKQWRYGIFDPESFAIYSAKDPAVTLECWLEVKKEMAAYNTQKAYEISKNLYPMAMYMSLRGIKAVPSKLAELKAEIKVKIEEAQAKLDALCGRPLNVNSSKQCAEYFYVTKKFAPYFKKKKVTTDDTAMTRLIAKGSQEAKYVQIIRGLRKLKSTYLDIAFDSDDRLRCSIKLSGTVEGRLSSSETIFGTGTNMQNLPKEFKQFLVADDGMILIEVDKVQAEWIATAYLSGDANMIEVAEKRLDAHVTTAKLMFPGIPEELILADHELCGSTTDEEVVTELRQKNIPEIFKYSPIRNMSCRQIAKKCNHGLNYDMGYKTFAITAEIAENVSKMMVAKYHAAYPGIRQWHKKIQNQLRINGTLVNYFGRSRRFFGRLGDEMFKAAYAHLPASTVVDMLDIGLASIWGLMQRRGVMYHIDPLMQVHDSFLFQYPLNRLDDLPTVLRLTFSELEPVVHYSGRDFIIPTDMKVGFDWKHMKGVERIDEDDEAQYYALKRIIDKIKPMTKEEVIAEGLKEVENEASPEIEDGGE